MKSRRYPRHHVWSVSLAVAFLFCPVFGLSGFAQAKQKKDAEPNSENQKAAEAAADRLLARFYETLDFGVIYRELFVADPLKHREVQITIGHTLLTGKDDLKVPSIEFATMERAYIAKGNFDFLVSAMNFTDDSDKESIRKELEPALKQYYMPLMSPKTWPILTGEQLDSRFTARFDQLNEVLRRHVVSKNYDTDLYSKRVAAFEESRPPEIDFVQHLTTQTVYVVQRERLHLYFVEEGGQFKMLAMTPRVQD